MEILHGEMNWCGTAVDRHTWVREATAIGLHCQLDATHRARSTTMHRRFGQAGMIEAEVAWQSLTPIMHRCSGWTGDDLFLKVVRRGEMMIEIDGRQQYFKEGDVVLVDPLSRFTETFRDTAHITVLQLPKQALHERGLCHRFNTACRPDVRDPDVRTVREFALHLTEYTDGASDQLLARLGEQCIDLMDIVVNVGGVLRAAPSSVTIGSRAKQVIARHIGNPDLDVAYIAAELNVSASSLVRAMRAEGLSPMRYALALRLEHAAKLLRNVSSPAYIQQIAYQSGFNNASHFSRVFKQHYGTTPKEFQIMHRQAGRKDATAPGSAD